MEVITLGLALFSLIPASWTLNITAVINCTEDEVSHYKLSDIYSIYIVYKDSKIAIIEKGSPPEQINESVIAVSNLNGDLSNRNAYLSGSINTKCQDVGKVKCLLFGMNTSDKNVEIEYKPQVECHDLDQESVESLAGDFSLHLMLSSICLVYIPFIIMPSIWCVCSHCGDEWKLLEFILPCFSIPKWMHKYISGTTAGIFGLLFVVSWIASLKGKTTGYGQYIIFVVAESIFMFLYTAFKIFFRVVEPRFTINNSDQESVESRAALVKENPEKKRCLRALRLGKDIAYNGCVATSLGAVTTPILCWLMIRYSPCSTVTSVYWAPEFCFWVFAIASAVSYIFVSHGREDTYWKKNN